ncbi:hypothetical protein [uncultured Paraglaciecola sp.]|uniref:hypothetical protein n=1 Tax=uncultured Paraglaciecola sp. TaxID=1765024 RepID=UPI00261BB43D|nr:hypothetical protein [uncultured Paraglaciecola sp.]
MMYQADDISITVDVTDQKTGAKIPASDFVAAKYEICSVSGSVLFAAEMPGDIKVADDDFVLTLPKAINNQDGEQKHEMRVRDAQGNESTIIQQFITNNKTSTRL